MDTESTAYKGYVRSGHISNVMKTIPNCEAKSVYKCFYSIHYPSYKTCDTE